ncbi:MAG TPA: DUF1501 domain-containing protein [Planctomycetaceae bacterium]|nr:DUF1501 domain-containing protein [Planctomycetaceae bacterium]|tara:strand:+ start:65 stop:1459 length:1395 start_codon:yes stop_codon:yes gene_type:complete
MLTILGPATSGKFCDGVSRRDFIRIGTFGSAAAGLSLPASLRAEARSRTGSSHKSIINVLLPGGAPHQDMVDLKPDAPKEIRGEFQPIDTNVEGVQISELMPRLAKMMDKFTIIRSMADSQPSHDLYQCVTGYARRENSPPAGGRPSIGAWISRWAGPVTPEVPPHMSLMYPTIERRWGDPGTGGFLGLAHGPFRVVDGKKGRDGKGLAESAQDMVLKGISLDQLQDRDRLRASLDRFRRDADAGGKIGAIDEFTEQALGILASSKLVDALDVSHEDPKIVERYGPANSDFVSDGAPRVTTNFLVARRLVEAGARYVTLNFSRWDWHGNNFGRARQDVPLLDQALTALVSDLHERGLDKDVSVVVWGEFGRTPKINGNAGRDHWPKANFAMLAGGGMNNGQVIGSTDRQAAEPDDRPVKFHEVFATLFHNIGLLNASARDRLFDLRGRPQAPIEEGVAPLRELV